MLRMQAWPSNSIGPADITDEKRVAGKHFLRRGRVFGVGRYYRYALGRVARCFKEFQSDGSNIQFVTIGDLVGWELRIRPLPVNDLRSGLCREFDVAADKIGVRMRLNNIFYLLAARLRFVNILLNVTLRIDDRCFAVRAQIIRSV